MLGFLYLVLILGWILVIIFLRCKKSITPHLTLSSNSQALGQSPSIHVIQLQQDDFRQASLHQSILEVDDIINPAYNNNDELMIINAPPPSYEEVMRQPEIYPKVQEVKST